MTGTPSVDTSVTNPSQTGGPGVQSDARPVNGETTPPESSQVPAADPAPAQEASEQAPPESGQPKVEEVPSSVDDAGVVIYEETGDAGLDLALSFIGGLGISGSDPAMVAAANGDFSFLEAKLSTLGDEARGWEKHIEIGKQAYQRQLDVYKAEQGKTLAAAHAVVGGEANWKNLIAWAGTVATPDEKAALNAMFDAGPIQAQAAARSILAAYEQAKGTTVRPSNPASAASGSTPAAPKALTRAEYAKEVDALYRKLGNRMDNSPEYADLKRQYFGR